MKLSKITTALLLGVVVFSSSSFALGTRAGTIVETEPTIEYEIGSRKIKERVEKAKYIVDKVISFKVERVTRMKQKTIKGLSLLAPFRVSNMGNSMENFVLNLSYGSIKDFSFEKSVIYIDKNRDGELDKSEEVDISVVKDLKPDSNQLVWLGAVTPKTVGLNDRVSFGLKGEASSGGEDSVYKEATKKNDNLKEDIVFGDESSEDDTTENNLYINRYVWSIDSNIELGIKLFTNIISADPVNGVCKNKKDALEGNYFSIPKATNVRSWEIYNNSVVTAEEIKFTVKADKKVERFATSSKNTWWRDDSRVHVLLSSSNKIIGVGKFNSSKDLVEFTIPKMRGGEKVYPHIVTEIK
jgi:hypothetical protein